jgi:hypothetical protein
MTPTIVLCECIVQRRYLFFVKLCFDNIMSIIMKVSYMKSNNVQYAPITTNSWRGVVDITFCDKVCQ